MPFLKVAAAPSAVASLARRTPARGRADLGPLLALLLWGLALGIAALVRRPDITRSGAFLFGDQSLNLHLADKLLGGGRLYADIAYQYGPIPAYGYAAFARIAGNTILSYNIFLLVISLLNLALAYFLLRRYSGRWVSTVIAGVGLTPFLLIPGSLVGGYAVSPYVPMERTALLLVCLLWSPPSRRTDAQNIGMGVVLGAMQGVKFGGAFFVGAAVLLLDLLALRVEGAGKGGVGNWIRSLLVTLGSFLALQAVWVVYALISLPAAIARDFLWPVYALKTYAAWMQPDERWPVWYGWRMFFGQQLTPVIGTVLGLAAVVYLVRSGRRKRAVGESDWRAELLPLLLPLIFYAVASAGFFRQVYHFYQFAWALVIPIAWLCRPYPKSLAAIVVLLIPCFALNVRAQFVNGTEADFEPMEIQGEPAIWLRAEMISDLQALQRGLTPDEFHGAVFFAIGGGMYHFYGIENDLRQPWFLPGFIRPYDERQFLEQLPHTRMLVIVRDTNENPGANRFCEMIGGRNPFSAATCTVLNSRLGAPRQIGMNFVAFPILP